MFDVNNLNTTATLTNLIENVNQSNQNNTNNDNLLLSAPITSSAYATQNDNNSSMLLTDLVVNATAAVVDYAAQWLTTTIATTAANLSSIGNETNTSSFYTFPAHSPTDSILNFNTTPSIGAGSYTNFTNPATDNIINTTSLSSSATFMLNADLIGENPKLADDGNNYDDLNECHPDNPKFNCSREDYIQFILGPQKLPLYKSLLITILYGGIFITGFFGNVLVCMVIFKHSTMHTATNYYLFSLAVSDLIYLTLGLPMEVILYWHQYPYLFGLTFCKARAYISEASTYVSVLTIVAFSVERYIAICHPLHLSAMRGFKRASRIIVLLWLLSFIGAIPFGIWTKINYWYYPPDQSQIKDSGYCGFDTPENIPLFEVSSLVSFFIPMFLIFYFYGRMGAKIRSRTTQQLGVQQGSMHRESTIQKSRRAVIRMLAAVVVTFFICWLPFHIQRLWYVHGKTHKYYQEVNEWLFSITGFAYYVTCTINPILYNVMSHRYRVAFKDILCRKRKNVYYNNGFARDQSSFRETTIASSLCNNSTYDRVHSVRVRSVRIVNNVKDRSSIKSNNISWKKSDFKEKDIPENHSTNLSGTNAVVVCVDNGVNGRTKVFTENEAQETLLSKNNETCI
ncbi:neuropeptides capa receptor [Calliphora vicina]|uniref:neuropeptides capa receptor n=1 Tax=Calliphora vicina TaxID=7373 RepID=UPI00325BF91C